MKKVLLVEHAPGRADGFLNFISEHQSPVKLLVWRCYKEASPPQSDINGLILSGGPMMVNELKNDQYDFFQAERNLIQLAKERELPTLGICLGAEILCDYFGGHIEPQQWVVGWHAVEILKEASVDPLFSGITSFTTFQYHRDHLARLPCKALTLVRSVNSTFEAFRIGNSFPIWGCIFHPEMEVKQVQSVFDSNPDVFTQHGVSRNELAPFDDGRRNRHLLLHNFFKIVLDNS